MLTLFSSRDSGDLKRASGDPALAKILIKYYLSYLFFNFISNVVIEYLLTELYVSIFLLTTILEQGILKLEVYGDLVINSKEFLDDPFKKTINCYNKVLHNNKTNNLQTKQRKLQRKQQTVTLKGYVH